MQFRVINQHQKRCHGNPLVLFKAAPPLEPLPGLAWPNGRDGLVRPSGEVWLRVAYGTLIPIYASGAADKALEAHLSGKAANRKTGSKRALAEGQSSGSDVDSEDRSREQQGGSTGLLPPRVPPPFGPCHQWCTTPQVVFGATKVPPRCNLGVL